MTFRFSNSIRIENDLRENFNENDCWVKTFVYGPLNGENPTLYSIIR